MKKTFLLLGLLAAMLASVQAQMVLVFDTELDTGTTVTLPLNGTVNVTVDWGDGNTEAVTTTGLKEHTYATEGEYTVQINGTLTTFGINNWPNLKLKRLTSFGEIGITNLNYAFMGATNLIEIPATLPPNVTNLKSMFFENTTFNLDITNWDVSHVTTMEAMFYIAQSFNQNIGNWNVSNVTTMSNMFLSASAFNQNIGNWNVSNVTNMYRMFRYASAFNQDIGAWDVSHVTTMNYMFFGVTLSTENYDSLLEGWSQQSLHPSIEFFGGGSKFSCMGKSARNLIITNNNWEISDAGLDDDTFNNISLPDIYGLCEISELTPPTLEICGQNITGTYNGQLPIIYNDPITWYFDDTQGTILSKQQNAIVDTIAPVIVCPESVSITLDEGEEYYIVGGSELDYTSATDNCTSIYFWNDYNGQEHLEYEWFPIGTHTIAWNAEDMVGNTSTCSYELTVTEFVGISKLNNTGLAVYPNPVKNTLHIEMSNKQNATVRLTDVSGRELLTVPATQNKMAIDMSSHENGLYFLHIETGSASETIKIIKQE